MPLLDTLGGVIGAPFLMPQSMNKKLLWLLTVLFLTAGAFAEAQQLSKKIPRIGFLAGGGDRKNPGPDYSLILRGSRRV